MIIDCHTHLGRNNHIKASVDELLASMDKAKIDKSLVFAGEMNDAPNDWLLDQVSNHRDRLFMVAAASPRKWPTLVEIQEEAMQLATWYGEGKIKAVKFYTGYEHFYPNDRVVEEYLMNLADVGCPVIFHSGDCLNSVKHAKLKYAHPLHIDEVAVDFPDIKFVIAHMGYPWHRDAAEVCYKNANVYADISGFVYGQFDAISAGNFRSALQEFITIAGTNKLMFGSDFPISDQKTYISTIISLESVDAVLGNTARTFFNL